MRSGPRGGAGRASQAETTSHKAGGVCRGREACSRAGRPLAEKTTRFPSRRTGRVACGVDTDRAEVTEAMTVSGQRRSGSPQSPSRQPLHPSVPLARRWNMAGGALMSALRLFQGREQVSQQTYLVAGFALNKGKHATQPLSAVRTKRGPKRGREMTPTGVRRIPYSQGLPCLSPAPRTTLAFRSRTCSGGRDAEGGRG